MEGQTIKLDTVLRLVANPARRRLLLKLVESNPQETTALAAKMADTDDEETTLRTQLYHTHLPMLENVRVIEWDRDTDAVIRGPVFGDVRPLLELIDEQHDAFPEHGV